MKKLLAMIIMISLTTAAGKAYGSESLVIAGGGAGIAVVQLLAKEFCASEEGKEVNIVVPDKSIKHAGGLKWAAGKEVFGRICRPMSAKDKETYPQLRELFVAKIKTGFAVNKTAKVSKLTMEQFKGIFTGKIKRWKEVGGADIPIILLGREKTEALYIALCKDYPFMIDAPFTRRYKKEHQIIKAIGKTPGSIGFSSRSGLKAAKKCVVLDIDGFSSGHNLGVAYDVQKETLPIVDKFKKFVKSERWLNALESNGFLPPEQM